MANLLLSLILVATQLISWGAVPLYFCACSSGWMCIDAGPDDCNCCHHVAGAAARSPCAHEHDDDQRPDCVGDSCDAGRQRSAALSVPCDCRHVALSAWSGPAIARMPDASSAGELVAPPATAGSTLATRPAGLSILGPAFPGPFRPTHFASTILGSVVLRC